MLARALDPDNASVLICGGAGVGMHTTRKLKDMGAWVYMMQRSDKLRSEIEQMMAVCVKGDALDTESVAKVMQGALLFCPGKGLAQEAFPLTPLGLRLMNQLQSSFK